MRDLRAALRTLLEGFDKGVFVRDISHDHEAGWTMRQMVYIVALGTLARAPEATEG